MATVDGDASAQSSTTTPSIDDDVRALTERLDELDRAANDNDIRGVMHIAPISPRWVFALMLVGAAIVVALAGMGVLTHDDRSMIARSFGSMHRFAHALALIFGGTILGEDVFSHVIVALRPPPAPQRLRALVVPAAIILSGALAFDDFRDDRREVVYVRYCAIALVVGALALMFGESLGHRLLARKRVKVR